MTSKYIQLGREREARDQATGADRGLVYQPEMGRRVAQFFGLLRHYKGEFAGQPFVLAPWQVDDIIMPPFSC